MPIKFPCEHCEQVLKVSASKSGRRARCPNCQGPVTVPSKDGAQTAIDDLRRKRQAGKVAAGDAAGSGSGAGSHGGSGGGSNKGSESGSHADGSAVSQTAAEFNPGGGETDFDGPDYQADGGYDEPAGPFSEFAVYDVDDDEFFYDDRPLYERRPVDADRVAVHRSVVYIQGGLLGAIALMCFVFGVVVGRNSYEPPATEAITGPFTISGSIEFKRHADDIRNPDVQAVVMIFPKDSRPDEKLQLTQSNLRQLAMEDNALKLMPVRQLGGDYDSVDAEGAFKLNVPGPGRYWVLVISSNAGRPAGDRVSTADAARIGAYFDPEYNVIGDRKYRLSEQAVKKDGTLEIVF